MRNRLCKYCGKLVPERLFSIFMSSEEEGVTTGCILCIRDKAVEAIGPEFRFNDVYAQRQLKDYCKYFKIRLETDARTNEET